MQRELRRPIDFKETSVKLGRLHLGAFDCAIDGWTNTDITPHIWIARTPLAAKALYALGKISKERYAAHRDGRFQRLQYVDLTKPLPFADNSFEAVYSSHVFEHLFMDEVERLVPEIRRVLLPGGVCRTLVPDMEKIVQKFDPEKPQPFITDIFEIGVRSAIKNAHHCGFTSASITQLFRSAGFSETSMCAYRQGDCPDIEQLDNRPDSIFFEARK